MSYYFSDPTAAAALKTEAESWIGTPYREFYEDDIATARTELAGLDVPLTVTSKGSTGGIDCIGLCEEIYSAIGASDEFIFPRTQADYQSNQLGDKVLTWLRGEAEDDQSAALHEMFEELTLPDPLTDDFFMPGDLLVMKHGSLFHMPIVIDDERHFVNALPRRGVVPGTIQDSTFRKYLVAAFRRLAS
jgi:cell wall-associated NlpC family hydrolase